MSAAWAIEALLASTLLMATVLIVRAPVRRAFGPQVAYALWALPMLRLVLPPIPAAWREAGTAPIARASETITVLVIEPLARPVAAVSSGSAPSIATILLAIWAIGAAGFFAWHLVRHARFCRRVLAGAVAIDEIAGIRVIASDAATGPLAFGIVRRYIAFPADFAARYEPRERDLALAHELGHHLRGDLIANWAALGVLAIHWYDPVAWIAFRAFRADQEMANDARVLAGRDPALRHAYACAIVKSAHGGAVSAACHLHTVNDLKGRLRMIGTGHVSRRRLASGAAVLTLAIAGGLGLTASGSATAAAIKARVGDTIGVDLQRDPPPLPAAPVPLSSEEAVDTTTVTTDDGNPVRKRVIRTSRSGRIAAAPDIPDISARDCEWGRDGDDKQFVIRSKKGDKQVTIICSNRIAKAAAEGARMGVEMAANGAEIERNAMATARDSLRTARAAIESERNLNGAQRREALAGLDQAQAEIAAQIAKGE